MIRTILLRAEDRVSRTILLLGVLVALVGACTPTVTGDATGPDAALAPVEITTIEDSAMWGPLAECIDSGSPSSRAPKRSSAAEGIDEVTAFAEEAGEEIESCGRYGVSPPVGGDWNPQSANCGFYASPVPVPPAVTALRRGAVWVVFQPDISEDDLETIRLATVHSGFILASPQAGLDAPLVLTAWGRQLRLDSTTDPRFDDFINTSTNNYRVPDINGPCRFGLGEPQDRYR